MNLTDKFSPEELASFGPEQIRYLSRREDLLRAALEDCLIAGPQLRDALLRKRPIWFDSFEPLYPQERTLILVESCRMFEIPLPQWLRQAAEDADRKTMAERAEIAKHEAGRG